mgnify:CR=1 FL=1|jgi:hypothetical protein
MGMYGAVRWQPTKVLTEAYSTAVEAMCEGRVIGRDALDCLAYLQALEAELVDRGVIDDPVRRLVASVGDHV